MNSIRSGIGIERGDKVTRLEAFVDAAFAFAVTLLVISGDQIPNSIDMLVDALKQVPAYAASFILIMQFWMSHADWSRQFGLEDTYSERLSIILVFVLLIFVYPLKMVFASFFSMLSNGYLPTKFAIESWTQVPILFQTFAIGFGAMALVMFLLFSRAETQGPRLGFTEVEMNHAKFKKRMYRLVVVFCILSFILTLVIPAKPETGVWIGTPGYVFFVLNIIQMILSRRHKKTISPS
jgi:uncharacterized membrane protein